MPKESLLSVLGPTSTGKTSLSLKLAKKLISENKFKGISLISADSRQVYQGLETLTGADVPQSFKKDESLKNKLQPYCFFQHQELPVELHGVSIISPLKEWSVTHFRNLAISEIQNCWSKNWLPIVVGGTGLYHSQLFNNDPQLYVRPNSQVRQQVGHKTVSELRKILTDLDKQKLEAMNHSDRNNPRRLIRAIEVAHALKEPSARIKHRPIFYEPKNYFKLGLKIKLKELESNIKDRVEKRLDSGVIREVEQLVKLNLSPKSQAMTATGVNSIIKYLQGQLNQSQLIKAWTLIEVQYAKRQITWFKKREDINWLHIDQPKKTLKKAYQKLK